MYRPTPSNLSASLESLSQARLSSYRSFFSPSSDRELYGIYSWNELISNSFMALTGTIEITLRNKFHSVLSKHVSITGKPFIGDPDSNDWYNHIGLNRKSLENIKDVTHTKHFSRTQNKFVYTPKPYPVPAHQVIASMTFGFWQQVLNTPLPWDTLLPLLLPNHRYAANSGHWKKSRNIGAIYERLEKVRQIRNRIAHLEPLWKIGDLYEEVRATKQSKPNIEFPAPSTPSEAIDRLTLLYSRATQLLYWLSKERAEDHLSTELHQRMLFLLSVEGLEFLKNGGMAKDARLGSLTKSWGLKLVMKQRQPLRITHESGIVGYYYPAP